MTVHNSAKQSSPFIVGMGGTIRSNSSTERALRLSLSAAERMGCRTLLLSGADIDFPNYRPASVEIIPAAERLVAALREADGVIIGSPGYHGCISGLVKNALYYLVEMKKHKRPYLDGRSVGCIATGAGWQGAVATLGALRDVVHALRGWPTPVGIAVNTAEAVSDPTDSGFSARTVNQINLMVQQVIQFTGRMADRVGSH
jgi:FMN reductase